MWKSLPVSEEQHRKSLKILVRKRERKRKGQGRWGWKVGSLRETSQTLWFPRQRCFQMLGGGTCLTESASKSYSGPVSPTFLTEHRLSLTVYPTIEHRNWILYHASDQNRKESERIDCSLQATYCGLVEGIHKKLKPFFRLFKVALMVFRWKPHFIVNWIFTEPGRIEQLA